MTCQHEHFGATVNVARLCRTETGPAHSFMAEIRITCGVCGTRFQFLGLRPGLDLQGARVSIDGMEANIAIVPEGFLPSPLDRIVVDLG